MIRAFIVKCTDYGHLIAYIEDPGQIMYFDASLKDTGYNS